MALTKAKLIADNAVKAVHIDETDTGITLAQLNVTGGITATSVSGNVTGNVTGDLTGNILTAAQPNITSVGTLSSLSVSGDLVVDTNTLYVDSTNNYIGIGITPTNTLDVKGGVTVQQASDVKWQNTARDTTYGAINSSASALAFKWAGTEYMRIDSTGSVGIGSVSPDGLLHAYSSTADANVTIETTATGNDARLNLRGNSSGTSQIRFGDEDSVNVGLITYFHTDNSLAFRNNASESMRLDSNGRLGIGTSSPKNTTHINGSLQVGYVDALNDAMVFSWNGASSYGKIQTYSSSALVLNPEGNNVGIGTTNPQANLQVGSNGYVKVYGANSASPGIFALGYDTDFSQIYVTNFGGNLVLNADASNTKGSSSMQFRVDDSEKLRINSVGDLGIGTTSPIQAIHLYRSGTFSTMLIENGNASGYALYQAKTPATGTWQWGAWTDDSFRISRAGIADHVTVFSGGNVSIGSTQQASLLRLSKNSNTNTIADSPSIIISNTSGTSGTFIGGGIFNNPYRDVNSYNITSGVWFENKNSQSAGAAAKKSDIVFGTTPDYSGGTLLTPTERMRITSGGEVLIGTTSTPNGTANYGSSFSYEGDGIMALRLATSSTAQLAVARFFNPNGQVGEIKTQQSSTLYVTSSDYRLKEDFQSVANPLDRINALNPINFAWKSGGLRVDGFLAHEVADVVPEAITGEKDAIDADGNPVYQGIDQSKLVPLLTAAIQELKSLIDNQQIEIDNLKAQLNG